MADSKYVTLVSKEGFEFVALREATLVSPTMKGMLRGNFSEAQTARCTFPEVRYVCRLLLLLVVLLLR
jgi:transcription elongation factor B subunit 1